MLFLYCQQDNSTRFSSFAEVNSDGVLHGSRIDANLSKFLFWKYLGGIYVVSIK